ncbi:ABC transporter permease [Methanofollis formosanus]|uniref:ABC transporter permease n=1 Tax=Methanofollis formosanus TaxID=299308 RepID=A0A8G1A2E8_9EURY|nr:FtsX-like permease family protein [Methanofollis formosanus]QYZ78837.1 ABC transporter permease [Methanofollis formosanus]
MSLSVSLFLAMRAVQRGNRWTFFLTVAIIALVFVNLVFLPSIILGVIDIFDRQSVDYTYGDLVIEPREDDLYIDEVSCLTHRVDRVPGVAGTSPRILVGATIAYRGTSLATSVVGFRPSEEREVTQIASRVVDGEFLSDGDKDQVLLGTLLAGNEDETKDKIDSLGGVQVGDTVTVTFGNGVTRDLRVKGIIETQAVGVDAQAYVTTQEIEEVYGLSDQASQVLVRLTEPGTEAEMKVTLLSYGVQEEVKTFREKAQGFVKDAIGSFDIINAISTLVSLIIAIVVIFIIIFINTVNKRKQIGILKAIGIERQVIITSYVAQVAFIALLGTAVGCALTAALFLYLTANPLVFPGGEVRPVVGAWIIARSILGLFAVSLVAGYVPAWLTTREEILDAIRG